LDKVANGYLFFGISTSSGVPYQECIGGSDPSLVAGYDSRFSQGSHSGVTQHEAVKNIPKFTKAQYVGLIIDQDKHELHYVIDGKKILAYSGIPSDVHVFACVAHDIVISFTRHIVGKDKVEKYLEKPETNYTPSDW
jgi:ABC-type microcin C transport system duplicated ATPase subunit YejF